ncbi:hypothetical protein ACSV4D_08780 [Flavobacterium sp. ARAG 55.4]|uniref:hypothetical protein n=1 Tax=Flavobacterium sp. ARAG 55.4 TaxID=3451357 RepID=UPI003F48C202
MSDNECLDKVRLEIEKKLNWEPSSLWKEFDYIMLAQIISEASSITISPHTLKRLFGKIKYNDQYNPQLATKDALSLFLGYSNWTDFILKNKTTTIEPSEVEKEITEKGKKKKGVFSPYLIMILMGLFSLMVYNV